MHVVFAGVMREILQWESRLIYRFRHFFGHIRKLSLTFSIKISNRFPSDRKDPCFRPLVFLQLRKAAIRAHQDVLHQVINIRGRHTFADKAANAFGKLAPNLLITRHAPNL